MEYNFSDRAKNLKGNAIREIFKVLADPEMISFAGGLPANDCLPIEKVKEITNQVLSSSEAKTILQYGGTTGYIPFLNTGIDYVRRVGINNISMDNIIAISGGQQGIDLMCKCFLNKGDAILVENPTYLAVLHILKTYEARAIGVDADDSGINVEDLERKIIENKPKFFYIVPTFSNPTGRTLSIEKRKAILKVCQKHNVLILEDDPYRELRFDGSPLPSMASLDTQGIVVYVTSFSKTISPGLRVGLAVANEKIIEKLTYAKQAVDVHTSLLSQAIVNGFIISGELDKQITQSLPKYRIKKEAMMEAIKKYMPSSFKYTNPEGGLFIWGEFDKESNINASEFFKPALDKKVAYVKGMEFFADGSGENTMRLNFSNSSLENIEIGIKRLGELFSK